RVQHRTLRGSPGLSELECPFFWQTDLAMLNKMGTGMSRNDDLYNELAFYTLAHPDPAFLHQLVVDAYAAQNADETTKPIAIVFALIGLYLHIEKGFTGKQVQRAHMQLARWPNTWTKSPLPASRGVIRIEDVLAAEPGPARDAVIERWCADVWASWQASRAQIVEVARKYLEVA
ncbi:MAG: DUF5946 family protein, partial [Terracidiphilus sp.]